MKTKLSLLLLILAMSPVSHAMSQVPQGINYQAIARDGAGAILNNKTFNIELTVQTSIGTEIWKELKLVTSNQFGLVTTVLGTGTNLVVGGVASFSMIDWNAQPLYLKTRVQYPETTWNVLGTSQLWSVPYSLLAKDLEGPVSKLGIEGTTTNSEESLFEVKNKNGEIVFAVYNEGVRVYVPDGAKGPKGGFAVSGWGYNKAVPENYLFVSPDSIRAYIWDDPLEKGAKGGFTVSGFNSSKSITNDYLNVSPDSVRIYIDKAPSTKGAKGGFTVSGYGTAKGEEEEYLRVTRDSTRIYINDETTPKGAKGGFTVAGFDKAKGINASYLSVATDATGIVNPSQNRILWYPAKNAFLTGKVLIEIPDSVGENSFASGYESKATGQYSQALGYQAIARGTNSTSIGYQSLANKSNSFAFGQFAQALNNETYAFGRGAIANGFRSYAFGSAGVDSVGAVTGVAFAKGDYSFAIGQGTISEGIGSFAIGIGDTARGDFSIAMGYLACAEMYGATSLGVSTLAKGYFATALGYTSKAIGHYSTATGLSTRAVGVGSTSIGGETQANGDFSLSSGRYSVAGGPYSTAMGYTAVTNGISALAIGYNATAGKNFSISIGRNTVSDGEGSAAIGDNSNSEGTASIAIGASSKSSGLGSAAVGTLSTANGDYSFATGYNAVSDGMYSVAIGTEASVTGSAAFALGAGVRAVGPNSIALGSVTRANGFASTALGRSTIADGDCSMALGTFTQAPSAYEIVTGLYNTLYTPSSTTDWSVSDRLFTIGNGTSNLSRSNALTVLKSGRIGLQSVLAPVYALELPNNGDIGIGQARAYAWATYSDGRLKSDQNLIPYGLAEIMKLLPKSYFHHNAVNKDGSVALETDGIYDIGLVAQEVYDIIPEAVSKPVDEQTGLWSMSYDKLVPVLVKAMQEQQRMIENQQMQIDELKLMVNLMVGNQ